jgi:hypothetical protein
MGVAEDLRNGFDNRSEQGWQIEFAGEGCPNLAKQFEFLRLAVGLEIERAQLLLAVAQGCFCLLVLSEFALGRLKLLLYFGKPIR